MLDEVEDRIEEAVVGSPDHDTLLTTDHARRALLSVRKLLWPTREAVGSLARGDPDPIAAETGKYARDVSDHLVQLVDPTATYRDLTAGAGDIYRTALSRPTNEVTMRLTVVATVILPPTSVVGLRGELRGDAGTRVARRVPRRARWHARRQRRLLAYFRRENWL